jgi:hypothetical protein
MKDKFNKDREILKKIKILEKNLNNSKNKNQNNNNNNKIKTQLKA